MATKWEYKFVENGSSAGMTKIQSMIGLINVNGRDGWEYVDVINFDGENAQLLLQRELAN